MISVRTINGEKEFIITLTESNITSVRYYSMIELSKQIIKKWPMELQRFCYDLIHQQSYEFTDELLHKTEAGKHNDARLMVLELAWENLNLNQSI